MSKYFPKAPFPNPPKKFTWWICLSLGIVAALALLFDCYRFAAIVALIDAGVLLASTAIAGL